MSEMDLLGVRRHCLGTGLWRLLGHSLAFRYTCVCRLFVCIRRHCVDGVRGFSGHRRRQGICLFARSKSQMPGSHPDILDDFDEIVSILSI